MRLVFRRRGVGGVDVDLVVSGLLLSGTTLANSTSGLPLSASFMNSIQIGSAARAPVSFFPSEICLSSKPTHTPEVICGVKPINQASV